MFQTMFAGEMTISKKLRVSINYLADLLYGLLF